METKSKTIEDNVKHIRKSEANKIFAKDILKRGLFVTGLSFLTGLTSIEADEKYGLPVLLGLSTLGGIKILIYDGAKEYISNPNLYMEKNHNLRIEY